MSSALRSLSVLKQRTPLRLCIQSNRPSFAPARALTASAFRRTQDDASNSVDRIGGQKDKHSTKADKLDRENGQTKADTLDDVFKMLDLPGFDPEDGVGSRIADRKHDTDGSDLRAKDSDIGMQDLFKEIDRNKEFGGISGRNNSKASGYSEGSNTEGSGVDPMDEFEKILSDLAADDTEVFRSDHSTPLFWGKPGGKESRARERESRGSYFDDINPDKLFRHGPRASAFYAGKLVSDPSKTTSIAARIFEDAKLNRQVSEQSEKRVKNRPPSKQELQGFKEKEHNQLGKLSQCRSVSALSSFVYEELLPRTNDVKSGFVARPSPVVFADAIRVSRELRVPQIAFFIYSYCRTKMELVDKLLVLDSAVYEELLATAWNAMRDTSAVFFILQDAIAMGVVGSPQLERQIDQIVVELRRLYNMDVLADQVAVLKHKISPKGSISEILAQNSDRASSKQLSELKRFNISQQ